MARVVWRSLLVVALSSTAWTACTVSFVNHPDVCATETCSGHGTCEPGPQGATCQCDPGWAAPLCLDCAAGYHDDGTGQCVVDEACAPTSCSGHGGCDDAGGVVTCSCEDAYDGVACEQCASGYQDQDGDGECLVACESPGAPTCGDSHQQCDDLTGEAICVCVVGYTSLGGVCTWTGGPLDPGFQQTDVWTADSTALVDTGAPGLDDSGEGQLSDAAMCSRGGIEQTFEMPSYADAEPLLLQLNVWREDVAVQCSRLAMVVGGAWTVFPAVVGWQQERLCLGDGAYGGDTTLRFTPNGECGSCVSGNPMLIPSYAVDNVVYVPDAMGECPLVGTVKNGDFEAGDLGWSFTTTLNGTAEVVAGVGSGGSQAGRLVTAGRCDSAILSGTLSVPLRSSLPQSALAFLADGTDGQALMITVQDEFVGSVPGNTGFPQTYHVCLTAGHRGAVRDVHLGLTAPGGLCADAYVQDFIIDDLTIVSEPACPVDALLVDPGFELALGNPIVAQPWKLTSPSTGNGSAAILSSAGQARSGQGVLRLEVSSPCSAASATTSFTVSAPQAGAGPALRYWYRATDILHGYLQTSPGNGPLVAAATWTQETVCLNPKDAGQVKQLSLTRTAGGGTCASTYAPEIALFDDLEVTTDPACPAQ